MIRFAPLLPLMLGLAACDRPAAENTAAPANAADAGVDYLARIAALPPAQQQLVLYRAIRDARQECQNITANERQPADDKGRAVWRVTCRGGVLYQVSIGRDGIANVTGPFAAPETAETSAAPANAQ